LGETANELREDIRFFMKAFQKAILEERIEDERPILVTDENSQQIPETQTWSGPKSISGGLYGSLMNKLLSRILQGNNSSLNVIPDFSYSS
jgi:hypothetical protein